MPTYQLFSENKKLISNERNNEKVTPDPDLSKD
jgi:hypothetical protein